MSYVQYYSVQFSKKLGGLHIKCAVNMLADLLFLYSENTRCTNLVVFISLGATPVLRRMYWQNRDLRLMGSKLRSSLSPIHGKFPNSLFDLNILKDIFLKILYMTTRMFKHT